MLEKAMVFDRIPGPNKGKGEQQWDVL